MRDTELDQVVGGTTGGVVKLIASDGSVEEPLGSDGNLVPQDLGTVPQ